MPYKKNRRKATGLKTKKRGALYEKIFRGVCIDQGAHCLRVEDGARVIPIRLPQSIIASYPGRLIGQVIRVKQPFDFIINYKSNIIMCDVKTTSEKRLSFSYLNTVVKDHQRLSLLQMKSGCKSGLFYFFIETGNCIYFDIDTICNLKPRKSLTESDGILLGKENDFDLSLIFK